MSQHIDDLDQDHEPYRQDDELEQREEDEGSVTSSVAADREALKEYPGADFRVAPEESNGFYMMIYFNISCFISFVLMLTASCPIPWYKSGEGDKWTLWKNNSGTRWQKVGCQQKKQMFQAMEAFSVSSVFLSLIALVAGVLQMTGVGHFGFTLLSSFVTMVTTLVSWALCVHQYHKKNCLDSPYVNHIARLQAGFALSLISFVFMMIAFFSVVYYLTKIYALEELTREKFSFHALMSAILIGICLLIGTVGAAFTMWEDYFTDFTVKITLWHVEILHRDDGLSEFWAIGSYHCKGLLNNFKVGQAFVIIGDIFLFFTLLSAVAAVYKRVFKWVTAGLGLLSFIFLVICWAVMLSTRYRTFCKSAPKIPFPNGMRAIPNGSMSEQRVNFTGFIITEGLGMIISASCGVLCAVALLLVKG